ncbi:MULTISPECIES: DUF4040 domain-containing protein [Methanocalculus]|uniref:DUF4040 domain-containing protein n=1 Tax=Methanocalculus TaxID=71151 RepID=UPI0020A03E86|nr:DUF4040 domain-containing protein [Methanocalculus sp. AMF5]MCP1661881.1 multicomponent Na+:H+ antiporter subunit B [Methanocalculus sp. AMF5]
MIWFLNGALLLALIVLAIWALRSRDLLVAAMILSVYSFLMAIIYAQLNSPDVALTEAAIGAGITTALFILAIRMTARMEEETDDNKIRIGPLVVVLTVGAILALAAAGMPAFGSPDSPGATVTGNPYIEEGQKIMGVSNVVTSIIAYFRAFDTLGEVTVIFAVGIIIIGLFIQGRVRRDDFE